VKFLAWAVIAYFVVSWILQARKVPRQMNDSRYPDRQIESIVQCAYCGLHVPASEAVMTSAGTVFCCTEHRDKKSKLEL
jgi:uncharacterized protein